jgi:hypothetical protein
MNIIDTLKDKNLLGQFIIDSSTWRAWFTFLKAFFAIRPTKADLETFKSCTGRSVWPTDPAREAWLSVGTRGGKSYVIALLATFLAVFKEHKLSPGERGYVLIVAPTKRQSGIIKGYLSAFFSDNELLKPYVIRETSEEVELSNNVTIAVLSSDYRSLRGYTAIAAIIDEVAFLMAEGSKPDTEIVRALRSRLTSTGGPLICISSPYAKRGELYKTHTKHFAKDGSPILVWQADSLTMNPTLDKAMIAGVYEEDPEGSKADYGAQFRSDIEDYIAREIVEACVCPGRYELPPSRHEYFGFVDPSGGSVDSMTLCITHTEGPVSVVDLVREVKPPFGPDQVCQDFAADLKRYRIGTVYGDRYAGEWPRERFKVHGIGYVPAEKAKSDIYRDFLPRLMSGEVELLDNARMVDQLVGLERRTGRGGKDSIDHPPHGHDDVANAVAGSVVCASQVVTFGVWGREYRDRQRPPFPIRRRLDIQKMFPGAVKDSIRIISRD